MKKLYRYLYISIFIPFTLSAQIPNNDFEDWSGGEPLFWSTTNNSECWPASVNITQTTKAYSGNYAVKGEVISAVDECNGGTVELFYPGLNSGTAKAPDWNGYPIASRPKELKGYFIFKPIGESAYFNITVTLTKWKNNVSLGIGSGGKTFANTFFLDSVYTEFVVPINYYYPDVPDTIRINFSIGGGEAGSTFYLDSISLAANGSDSVKVLPPHLEVIKPDSDDILIAGETDTITYIGAVSNVNLWYSTDGGITFALIDSNYFSVLEDTSVYLWNVPDTLLTRKAIIKVQDIQDSALSSNFKIKPWQLTRVNEDGNFELFTPDHDGWSFCNCGYNIWPKSWYKQFDYQNGNDPNTNEKYPNMTPFDSALASNFPDWPLFVEAFGISQCYYPDSKVYKKRALTIWAGRAGSWGGSCSGFAATSLLYFYYKSDFINQSGLGDFNNLFSAKLNDVNRRIINKYHIYQFGKPFNSSQNTNARQTLQALKDMFSQDNTDARTLSYYNLDTTAAHRVTPYKLERIGDTSIFKLRVYNSNNPGSAKDIIFIDSLDNTWKEKTGFNWGKDTNNCFLRIENGKYLNGPNLTKQNFLPQIDVNKTSQLSMLRLYNTSNGNISIYSENEGAIKFSDGILVNTLSLAMPIIPETGNFHPPIGYDLPKGNYSIQLSKFSDTSPYVFFMADSTIYNYRRYDANPNETDYLRYSDGIEIENSDTSIKSINLETIIDEKTSEKDFEMNNIQISQDDSVNIKEMDRKDLLLNNYGVGKDYDLHLRSASDNDEKLFFHSHVQLTSNSSHQIEPDWSNLETSPVKILIDNDNDGTIDDSMFISNEVTEVEGRYSSGIPSRFTLYQNYPNPFNPTTTIKYNLPKRSFVTLKVYNILGEEVAVLVNGVKQAGSYSVVFNASSLSSGVYIYTLATDEFVSSKKMLVIK